MVPGYGKIGPNNVERGVSVQNTLVVFMCCIVPKRVTCSVDEFALHVRPTHQ